MDVVTAAWVASGSPPLSDPVRLGRCSRCGRHDAPVQPSHRVVSAQFTDYDAWVDVSSGQLCAACSWGYRHPALRAGAHRITRTPVSLASCSRSEVTTLLTKGRLPVDVAVVVPLHPGRKHLVPVAQWGKVTTDAVAVTWTDHDAARLTVMQQLRALGFGSRMLDQPVPPWRTFTALSSDHQHTARQLWPQLDPWRHRRPWMDLAAWACPHRFAEAAA